MKTLKGTYPVDIRFGETDAMGVVWHGNYLKYFEDGRERFGDEFGLSYLGVYNSGFFTPIVESQIKHLSPIYYGDKITVTITYKPTKACKICFDYEIFNVTTGKVSAKGQTIQVFMDAESRELVLYAPKFYSEWLEKWSK